VYFTSSCCNTHTFWQWGGTEVLIRVPLVYIPVLLQSNCTNTVGKMCMRVQILLLTHIAFHRVLFYNTNKQVVISVLIMMFQV
jgi:hypothetical protein